MPFQDNMEKLRIVFMGTPDFAVASLKALIDNGHNIVGVVTAPDKPAGRGRRIQESSVKQFAMSHGLKILQPTNLKSDTFLQDLKELRGDLQIVVAFRMLPKAVWSLPQYGTFNLHASLLPDYRGAAPINWALINGETETGVTTFFIDDNIDTGEIIMQKSVPISEEDSAGSLHDTLMDEGSKLVLETVLQIQQKNIRPQPQPVMTHPKAAPKLDRENCRIHWNWSTSQIYNHIRGLSPYPVAWTMFHSTNDSIPIKIYSAKKEIETHNYEPGTLISNAKTMKIATKDGYIHPLEIQWPGKRKMGIKDLLNGLKIDAFQKAL